MSYFILLEQSQRLSFCLSKIQVVPPEYEVLCSLFRAARRLLLGDPWKVMLCFVFHVSFQVTIVEKADSSSVLPSPLSISTRNRMTFLFANLKDRDFLVQRISDFLQQTTSKIYSDKEFAGSYNSSDDEVCGRRLRVFAFVLLCPRMFPSSSVLFDLQALQLC